MKRMIALLICAIILTMPVLARGLSASEMEIIDALKRETNVAGECFTVTSEYVVQIENYLKGRSEPLSEKQASDVLDAIEDIRSAVSESGETDFAVMSASVKESVVLSLKSAVKAIDPHAVVYVDTNTLDVIVKDEDGYVIFESTDMIKVTGNVTDELKIVFVVAVCGAVALVICIYIAKKMKLL